MIDAGLKDKVVLVTGGNNPYGIGAAAARVFAEQGAGVFIHYYRLESTKDKSSLSRESGRPGMDFFYEQQHKDAKEVLASIKDIGGRADSWECDLKDTSVIPELFDRAEKSLGPVDVLVNNAVDYEADSFINRTVSEDSSDGLWEEGPSVSTISEETFNRHFFTNTRAVVLLSAEFFKRFIKNNKKQGRIINISADCAQGCPAEISYRASKYAIESYSRSAAAEMGPYGITVNVISPGPVQTGYIAKELEKELLKEIPLREIGKPEDIANAVLFFASDQAQWITGQVLFVHGGHRMALGR